MSRWDFVLKKSHVVLAILVFLIGALLFLNPQIFASRALLTPETMPVAITGVNVIPMDSERVLSNQTVVIRDGRITSIGPSQSVEVPGDSLRIDAEGKYLIPGLVDAHVHTHHTEDLLLYLANGVTTIRVLDGESRHLRWRQKIEEGLLVGPNVLACPMVKKVKGKKGAAKKVREVQQRGFSCLKLYSPPQWKEDDCRALAASARKLRLPLVGHLPRNLPAEFALQDGQGEVSHAEEFLYTYFFRPANRREGKLNEDLIPVLAKLVAESKVTVVPNLVAYHHIGMMTGEDFSRLQEMPELRYLPKPVRRKWGPHQNRYRKRFDQTGSERLLRAWAFLQKLVKAMQEAGVPQMVGTDASRNMPFLVPGFSVHQELQELVDAGLTPYQALSAATANPGKFLSAGDGVGTVAAGARADLVLLTANPLEDISNTKEIAGVMVRGRWFPRKELDRKLKELAESYR